MLSNFDIGRGFLKREDILKLLDDCKNRADITSSMDLEGKILAKLLKGVQQTIAIRLRVAFQRQIQLDFAEACSYYNSNIEELNVKIDLFYYIIDYLNDIGITYIPDKLTTGAYFRVSVETFELLMTDAQVDPAVQKLFRTLDEFILSLTQTGLETGALNSYAWQRLHLKSKYGGHEISTPESSQPKQTVIITNEIQRKLKNNYDFTKMISETEKQEKKEG